MSILLASNLRKHITLHRGNIEKTKLNSLLNHYNISHHLCGHYDFYAWAGLEVSEAYESGSFGRNLRLARKKESNEEGYRSSRTLIGTKCVLFLLMLSTSVIFNISKIQTIAHSLSEENTQTIFYMVKNDIENEFFQPIAVSDTIAQDLELRALFEPQLSSAGEDRSEEVVEILGSIQKAFGYKMLFAICDATGTTIRTKD